MQAWHNKFKAMHYNANVLAKEVSKHELYISELKKSENLAQSLYSKQKEVVDASIALANRDRKT